MKPWIVGLMAAVAAAIFSTNTPAHARIQVQLGPPPEAFFPEVRAFLEQLAASYNQAQNEVTVVVAPDNPEFLRQTLTRDMLGDVVFVTTARYGEASTLAAYAEAGFLEALDEYVNAPDFNRGDYIAGTWNLATVDGSIYGLPLVARSWAIGVNTAYCDPNQVASKLDSWDSWIGFMETKEHDLDSDGLPDGLMTHTAHDARFMWEALFLAYGGDPNDPASFNAGSEAWQTATTQTLRLLETHPALFASRSDWRQRFHMFGQPIQFVHNDAMDPGSLPLLKRRSPAWQVFAPPGTSALPGLDATVAAIAASEPERIAAAWSFLSWLSSSDVMAAVYPAADLVPLRRSVIESLNDASMHVFASTLERIAFQRPQRHEHSGLIDLKQQLRSGEHE